MPLGSVSLANALITSTESGAVVVGADVIVVVFKDGVALLLMCLIWSHPYLANISKFETSVKSDRFLTDTNRSLSSGSEFKVAI